MDFVFPWFDFHAWLGIKYQATNIGLQRAAGPTSAAAGKGQHVLEERDWAGKGQD